LGLTVGALDGSSRSHLEIGRLSFVGPSGCCSKALPINEVHNTLLDDVNFFCGSTGYALNIEGSLWVRGYVHVAEGTANYFAFTRPHSGIRIASSNTPYQSNVCDLRVSIHQVDDVGVFLDGANFMSATTRLTGSIEGYGTKPLWIYNQSLVSVKDLYVEGSGTEVLVDKCRNVHIDNLLINDNSCNLKFTRSSQCSVDNFQVRTLEIGQDCLGMVVGNGSCGDWNGLKDYAPDTRYTGNVIMAYGNGRSNYCTTGHDARNIFYNSGFSRWQADRPDGGWGKDGHNTWTQCGTGLADTTNHMSPYCAKVIASGADPWVYFSFDATQLQQMLGKWVNFSFWGKLAAGQSFNSYPTVFMSFTVPAW
jgi:hypothetical protein